MCELSQSKWIKHSSVCVKVDESKGFKDGSLMNNFYHVTMVLRQNGRIEVYYNFEYIYSFDIMPEGLVCVDVDNDNDYFYLKYVTERNFRAK